MHNVNASAAILQHDTLTPAAAASPASFTPANKAHRPLMVLKGGASVRYPDALADSFTATGHSGPVAACISRMQSTLTKFRLKLKSRKDARMRRLSHDAVVHLSNHILKDIGLSRGRMDAALRDASLHGPKL